jgi:methionine-S-sulfoxide reductase
MLVLAASAVAAVLAIGTLAAGEPPVPETAKEDLAVATFAAGCFWCTESDFDKVEGVIATVSGFMGGQAKNPTYEEVGRGGTGHTEVVRVTYDPKRVTYERLLDQYWHNVDLVDGSGQFCDRGDQYRPVIFAHTDEQRRLAETSKAALAQSGRFQKPIAVTIESASDFTAAEEYHQDYYKKNSLRYRYYRWGCGRDARLKELWGTDAGH